VEEVEVLKLGELGLSLVVQTLKAVTELLTVITDVLEKVL